VSQPPPVSADSFVTGARPGEAAEIARIQIDRWRSGYRGFVPDAVLDEITNENAGRSCADHWAASLASPPTTRHRVLVAVTSTPSGDRLVVGFASFGPATDPGLWAATDAELYELCVAADQRGHGHGGRLLNAAAATMADDGFHTAHAWLLEQDTAAARFLESAGWAPDGARRSLDMGTPIPTLRLHTNLAPPASE
jgi:GNAT superfamily N-acetyltransferase